MSEMLDPKTLTPESLYKLQSDTWEQGAIAERERIIKLLEANLDDDIETDSMFHQNAGIQIAIALIRGENKHTHEIEVFGAPCLGGDYHEYCLKCGWVEPCEIDGENK